MCSQLVHKANLTLALTPYLTLTQTLAGSNELSATHYNLSPWASKIAIYPLSAYSRATPHLPIDLFYIIADLAAS